MAIKTLTGGAFQDSGGNAIALGSITFQLSSPAVVSGTGQVVEDVPITYGLDSSGNIVLSNPTPSLWGNDQLTPTGTFYTVNIFNASGALVRGPENWVLQGTSPISLTAIVASTPAVSYSGAVLLTPAGNQTITTGTLSVPAGIVAPITGVVTTQELNNVLYADQFSGADIGAQINAAYAALPSFGGTILISPKSDGSRYDFSTPIVLTTAGKYVRLEGIGSSGAQNSSSIGGITLNFTPTSGTAITLDYVSASISPLSSAHGLRNLTLVNNGHLTTGSATGTAIGIACGTTNQGCYGATMNSVSVIGFPIGFKNANSNSVQIAWINPQFMSNTVGFQLENITGFWLFGGQIAGNATGFKANSVNAAAEIALYGTEFFANTSTCLDFTALSGSVALVSCHGAHFETSPASTASFFDGAFNLDIHGGLFEATGSGTTAFMIRNSGQYVGIFGTKFAASGTTTTIVSASSPCRGTIQGHDLSNGHFTNYVSGANAAFFSQLMSPGPSSVAAVAWSLEPPLSLTSKITGYNGIATAGVGAAIVYGATKQKSETSADTNVLTYTPPATAGQYRVNFSLSLSAASSAVLGWTVTWKDANGTAQAPTNLSLLQSGTAAPALTFTTSTTSTFSGSQVIDVDNSATAIVVKLTLGSGTFTGKVSASIEQLQ